MIRVAPPQGLAQPKALAQPKDERGRMIGASYACNACGVQLEDGLKGFCSSECAESAPADKETKTWTRSDVSRFLVNTVSERARSMCVWA